MLYLNNAATGFPKTDAVAQALARAVMTPPHNPYREACHDGDAVMLTRERLAALVGCSSAERVIFTSGATAALNMLIGGLLKPGEHLVTSRAEHNAVLRPVHREARCRAIRHTLVSCDRLGRVNPAQVAAAIEHDTRLVCLAHVGNVTGAVLDIAAVHALCQARRIPFIIDAAQSLGNIPIHAEDYPWAAIVFAGHKSLGGPMGVGGFILGRELDPEPWLVGGSGVFSESMDMPTALPLRYEAGTPNEPGIIALGVALEQLSEFGVAASGAHKRLLVAQLEEALGSCPALAWHAVPSAENPCGIVSLTMKGWSPRDLGYVLDQSFNIKTRSGLHCAPLIHEALGSAPEGTLRVSFSRFTSPADISAFAKAIVDIRGAA